MSTRKLTIRLPEEDIEFAKEYALRNGISVTEMIDRYLKNLRNQVRNELHPDIQRFSGIISDNIDVKTAYHDALEEKHR
jgi:predicted DNA binding CopG/RHH family protein